MDEKIKNVLSSTAKAIQLIRAKEGNKRGCAGTIPCPDCGKDLQYSIAKRNGHIWGKCSCGLAWMM